MRKVEMKDSYGDKLTIEKSKLTGGYVIDCRNGLMRICFWSKFKLRVFIKHLQRALDEWEVNDGFH